MLLFYFRYPLYQNSAFPHIRASAGRKQKALREALKKMSLKEQKSSQALDFRTEQNRLLKQLDLFRKTFSAPPQYCPTITEHSGTIPGKKKSLLCEHQLIPRPLERSLAWFPRKRSIPTRSSSAGSCPSHFRYRRKIPTIF